MSRIYYATAAAILTAAVATPPAFGQGPGAHDGKLFRVPGGQGEIWLVDQGLRRHVHAPAWRALFNDPPVEDIRQADLEKLFPLGDPVRDGAFIARHKDGAMFLVDAGRKREIRGMEALRRYRLSEVHFVAKTAEEIAAYPNGAPIDPPIRGPLGPSGPDKR